MPLWDYTRGTELHKRDALLGQNIEESLKNLRACLAVGRFDRAEAIFRRLAKQSIFNVAEVLEANNTYVRSMVHGLFRGQDGVALRKLQMWFEVDMRQLGISPDATTLALMCRSAFLLASEKSRDRTLRRYLCIAEEAGILHETIESGEYLPHEFNQIARAREDLFEQLPEEVDQTADEVQFSSAPVPAPPAVVLNPASQRGYGLETLLKGLRSLHTDDSVAQLDDHQRSNWQISLEEDIVTAELERWRLEHAAILKMGINPALSSKSMEALMWEWQDKLTKEIKAYLSSISKNSPKYVHGDGPYLEQIGPQKLAAITIIETIRTLTCEGISDGAPVFRVTDNLGKSLEMQSSVDNIQNRQETKLRHAKSGQRNKMMKTLRVNKGIETNLGKGGLIPLETKLARERRSDEWPKVARFRSAALLLSKLIEVARFPKKQTNVESGTKARVESTLAFSHAIIRVNGKKKGMLYVDQELAKRLTKEPPPCNMAHQLPMVAPPESWSDFTGAYLRYPANLMRLKDPSGIQDMYLHAAIENGNLGKVFAGLNVLGKTEWRINRAVFEVMANTWNSGEAVTNFPASNPSLELPQEPEESAIPLTKFKWKRECQRLQNEYNGFHSNRCYMNLQMEIARAFLGHTFFLPHNMDFRGRAYPVAGIFHHMGADNARGLFQFAKGKALGEEGLFWLKVHLSNTFGFDKASLEERAQFTMDHLDDIKDSTQNPQNGRRWWLKADDPWQCLATCFELLAAMESPDPKEYISHLPVHQDGTCNGLQHYAALGGDELGAAQVNLIPKDRPGDIYSEVARLVKADVEKDSEAGNPIAKILHGKISRKLVKQPVMTYVYGVTYFGARAQLQKRLDEIIVDSPSNEIRNFTIAVYLTKKVFTHFGTMFSGATRIQHWLAECAGRISTAVTPEQVEKIRKLNMEKERQAGKILKKKDHFLKFQSGVVWTTPLNLPVVQPYREVDKTKSVATALQSFNIFFPSVNDSVHKRKQMAGFPPNFVHSLDATHMLLSALKCDQLGLSFASVHDSFWTHAADVPTMSRALRDAFVEIHGEDVIGRLAEEFKTRYKRSMYRLSCPSLSPLGLQIRKLRAERRKGYGRGKNNLGAPVKEKLGRDEMIDEYDRLSLLQSEDPAERAKGEAMVTPGSLFAALGPEHHDLLHPVDLQKLLNPEDTSAASDHNIDAALEEEMEAAPDHNTDDAPEEEIEAATEEQSEAVPGVKKAKRPHTKTYFWVPLTFPTVPQKGSFDVQIVKDSTYFFS
ncbi:DNA/RNA polymerase [Microthyrium microscopicum]|uniref:DNA-directed RNA polymerase n=1 Tax=Microthyrium microscopicum TaxID=703497 RepID=A0A6A6UL68_9PEZI|nr:DNA/RNA polymerase [Microthyrium microscopicum]